MMTCEEIRLAMGAHALGALDPDEALEIDDHLATCEACGAELVEFEGVASFLGKVSERDVELVSSPPRQVLDRLLNDRARRNRRGRVLMAVAASAAVLVVGGTVWTTVNTTSHEGSAAAPAAANSSQSSQEKAEAEPRAELYSDSKPSASTAPVPKPTERAVAGREFAGGNTTMGYRATVTAFPGDGGTELSVSVDGVPAGTTARLVVVSRDGRRDPAGSWDVRYQDNAVFKSTTSLPMGDIARFELVDEKGKALVRIPVRK
ncbi:anti-sigma factor family protein [Nonomuraea diastatica]|uniref:Zf-HC2 domain-containing protein n=1 Tax=Nonomuraea diastatica TaxID=1848329 RepID=A0A4R4W7I4_9ACTN|nr:zf-HC2 domain-containing protein [Nonomuraea diastatica]TDD14649.1 zf-HC2 domain-containing protein [Nonomuraea diastatica]